MGAIRDSSCIVLSGRTPGPWSGSGRGERITLKGLMALVSMGGMADEYGMTNDERPNDEGMTNERMTKRHLPTNGLSGWQSLRPDACASKAGRPIRDSEIRTFVIPSSLGISSFVIHPTVSILTAHALYAGWLEYGSNEACVSWLVSSKCIGTKTWPGWTAWVSTALTLIRPRCDTSQT